MSKDNIGQGVLSFFIVIFFVIGAVFAFSNRKKIVDFFKSKGILKSIRNPSVQNVPQKGNKNPNPKLNKNIDTSSFLNDQNKNRGSNNNGKNELPKKRTTINEDSSNDDDEEEEEYQKNYPHEEKNKASNDRKRVESNNNTSSSNSWFLLSFFKNIFSVFFWLLTFLMDIIIKIFFSFFGQIITSFVVLLFGILLFIFISMTVVNYIPFVNQFPKACYSFCFSRIEKVDFFNNHQNVKEYTGKFLKFILRANTEDDPAQANKNNVGLQEGIGGLVQNSMGGLGKNIFNILKPQSSP